MRPFSLPFLILLALSCEWQPPGDSAARRSATPPAPPEQPLDLSGCPDDPIARVGGADEAPVLVRKVDPVLPIEPPVTGIVIIELIITKAGSVCATRVLRPLHPDLDAAALAAVEQWEFAPAKRKGEPVQAAYRVTVSVRGRTTR